MKEFATINRPYSALATNVTAGEKWILEEPEIVTLDIPIDKDD